MYELSPVVEVAYSFSTLDESIVARMTARRKGYESKTATAARSGPRRHGDAGGPRTRLIGNMHLTCGGGGSHDGGLVCIQTLRSILLRTVCQDMELKD
mmetsp:Transcript_8353/g.15141  ORF Transcript_8353/g.15141 Transcript_8353/m.15141 type:complete len:98 (-) Transcript_8353:158-451(-)